MIAWFLEALISAVIVGCTSYTIAWCLHNFELTQNTLMAWADQQNTFLQKMISCSVCLTTQLVFLITTVQSLVFGLGFWTWFCTSLLGVFLALALVAKDPLTAKST